MQLFKEVWSVLVDGELNLLNVFLFKLQFIKSPVFQNIKVIRRVKKNKFYCMKLYSSTKNCKYSVSCNLMTTVCNLFHYYYINRNNFSMRLWLKKRLHTFIGIKKIFIRYQIEIKHINYRFSVPQIPLLITFSGQYLFLKFANFFG